jgi:hypothetical protein
MILAMRMHICLIFNNDWLSPNSFLKSVIEECCLLLSPWFPCMYNEPRAYIDDDYSEPTQASTCLPTKVRYFDSETRNRCITWVHWWFQLFPKPPALQISGHKSPLTTHHEAVSARRYPLMAITTRFLRNYVNLELWPCFLHDILTLPTWLSCTISIFTIYIYPYIHVRR